VKLTSAKSCADGIARSIEGPLKAPPVNCAKSKSETFSSPVFCSMGKYLSHSACSALSVCQALADRECWCGARLTQSMSSAPCIITSPPVTTLPCRLLLVVESVHSMGGGLKFRGSSGAAVLGGTGGAVAATAATLASAPAAD